MKAAIIQQLASTDRRANLKKGLENLSRAADMGASLVCFAELAFEPFYSQFLSAGKNELLAECIPGPTSEAFQEASARHGVVAVINLYERSGENYYNTSPIIDSNGALVGKTRMVHITDYALFFERGYYAPGDLGAPVFDTSLGRMGIAICYDRHFPEYMRALAIGGAEVVVVPQAGVVDEWPPGLHEAEMRASSFINGYFTILANRVGQEDALHFAGESFVCGPDGTVIARAPQSEEAVLCFDLDLSVVGSSPARRLFLPDRRPDLYADWI